MTDTKLLKAITETEHKLDEYFDGVYKYFFMVTEDKYTIEEEWEFYRDLMARKYEFEDSFYKTICSINVARSGENE